MERRDISLVILAAGIGSRFGGGIKQLKAAGPSGEIIMDYSIHDAIEAGFRRIVFIIRHEIQEEFEEVIGRRLRPVCEKRGVELVYAFQEKEDLPAPFTCPPERTKPWGTGHALLSCHGLLPGPFVVINADDYYGKAAFRKLFVFLADLREDSKSRYCMAGFRLGNTLSDFGGVTRGICEVNDVDRLVRVFETRHIVKTPEGAAVERNGREVPLDVDAPVSMNMWGATPDLLDKLESRFSDFLSEQGNDPGAEFLIPIEIDRMLEEGSVSVEVLHTNDHWFGITYHEDLANVIDAFQKLVEDGVYPSPLYQED